MSGIQQMLLGGATFVQLFDNDGGPWSGAMSRGLGYKVGNDGIGEFASWLDLSGSGSYGADAAYGSAWTWTNGTPANYAVRCTVNSGTTPSGSATGSWLSCNTSREWYIEDTVVGGGVVATDCTIEIRDVVSLTVLATASFAVSLERTF